VSDSEEYPGLAYEQQLSQMRSLDREHPWPVAFVSVKRLYPDAKLPEYKTRGAAGADLCAYLKAMPGAYPLLEGGPVSYTIFSGRCACVPTGVAVQLPSGSHGMVKGRSSLALQGVDAHIGTLDMDYVGPLHVLLYNHSHLPYTIADGDRIGQLVIVPTMRGLFGEVDELRPTERGAGGFGSTGR
jgi:dUTP pyrophosphatase